MSFLFGIAGIAIVTILLLAVIIWAKVIDEPSNEPSNELMSLS